MNDMIPPPDKVGSGRPESNGQPIAGQASIERDEVGKAGACSVFYADEVAERAAAARAEAAEEIAQDAVAKIADDNLSLDDLLAIVRQAGRETAHGDMSCRKLKKRFVEALCERVGFEMECVEDLVEWSIEIGRERLDEVFDDERAERSVKELAARYFGGYGDSVGPIPDVCLENLTRARGEPAQAFADIEAPSALNEAPAPPEALPDEDAVERQAIARAVTAIKSCRGGPLDPLLGSVRRITYRESSIPTERLANLVISTSGEMSEYAQDAIRLSIDETRRAGGAFDDAEVEATVDRGLRAIYAPITGQPGPVERKAEQVVAAMSPKGTKGPTPFFWTDPHKLARRAWLYATLFIRKELTATIAPGGGGKTALTIVEALALASGRPLLGVMPAKRCRVWIWSGEEPLEELQKRILAACEFYGLTAADIDGWLFVDNFESFDFIIAEQTRDGTTVNQPKVNLLISWITNNEIDILFIDPAISTHNVGENDNVAVQKWATAWKSVAVGANAAISLAHHAKKLGGQTATADDSRGARSFVDKCRIVRSLNPMTKDEAGRFQLPEEDRRYFFSIDPTEAKANMAPAVGGKEWFRSHSVMLGAKRNDDLDKGESVGVVGRWKPPAPADKLDEDKIEAIREAVGGKSWRAAALTFSRPDSIGAPIAEVFGLDLASPADRRRANAIYGALLKQGVFVEEKVPDENYKLRPFARLAD